jgi:hypothetical protein
MLETSPYRTSPVPSAPTETQTLLSSAIALAIGSLLVQIVVPLIGAPLGLCLGAMGMSRSAALLDRLGRETGVAPFDRYSAIAARWLSVAGFWVAALQLAIGFLSIVAFFVSVLVAGGHVALGLVDVVGTGLGVVGTILGGILDVLRAVLPTHY